jgi:hypothetical protein
LPQSGPNACAQRNETGSPETTSNSLSIATSHQPRWLLSNTLILGALIVALVLGTLIVVPMVVRAITYQEQELEVTAEST